MFSIGLTDHVESPLDRPAAEVYAEAADVIRLADSLGVKYAWFAEHHVYIHRGHLPAPLLLALHLAGKTRQIHLGMAITCLNLHGALETAEQVALADCLMSGRLAPGFGSGSTPAEAAWMGVIDPPDEAERHARFANALDVLRMAWDEGRAPTPGQFLPRATADLRTRSWIAVNSSGSATIAGRFGGNMLFSHLRTPAQHREYSAAYRAAGGTGLIAMNRPIYVGADDAVAFAEAEGPLRTLWRRFRSEGKIPASAAEPEALRHVCGHPINFIVGGAESVARQIADLYAQCPFNVLNAEVRWDGLSHGQVLESLRRFMDIYGGRQELRISARCQLHTEASEDRLNQR